MFCFFFAPEKRLDVVSVASGLFILFLIISEFSIYRTVKSVDKVLDLTSDLSSLCS